MASTATDITKRNAGAAEGDVAMEEDDRSSENEEHQEEQENNDDDDDDEEEDPATQEANRLRLEQQARKYVAAQTHEVIIPSYSAWFSMSSIHPLEQRALPEFFNSKNRSKTPAIYKEYRDFMINTYRLRPSEYLTITACRRNLAGDVCAVMRVHAFLEQWGLINYQVDPEGRPSALGPPFTGHFRVILDTPRGLQSLNPGTKLAKPGTTMPQKPTAPPSIAFQKSIYQTTNKSAKPVSEAEALALEKSAAQSTGVSAINYSCDTCGVDCTNERYHSLKIRDYELCPPCYLDGRFPSTMFSGDFVKLTTTTNGVAGADVEEKAGAETWSDAETLLLLEGIELYDDDWVSIAEHVGTKSREACVLKFLQLPIEEGYDDGPSGPNGASKAVGVNGVKSEGDLGLLRYSKIPFDKVDNPVLSVAAFLAGVKGAESAKAKVSGATEGSEVKNEAMEVEEGDGASKAKGSGTLKSTLSMAPTSRTAHLAMQHTASAAASLATEADNQIRESLTKLVGAQIRKLELKMAQFEEMEEALEDERRGVEALRLSLLSERAQIRRWLEGVNANAGGAINKPLVAEAVGLLQGGSGGRLHLQNVDTSQGMAPGDPGAPVADGAYGTLV
ncbi:Chromatin structure-remodeling complex protein RSC8 AltName: Full=Remodel the structure of chromatin complex subunit 8; AltName: Full=SWI3 homolog [Serendipita indica DSM 11827]|nr:Chromatin structure-remodeling complex protein RSC8 AltName: Full=Remodel the structure of chromatin complex subunit 8; AltName: Full=SWI3 homolog [Serendipita indica DSM 11827]